MPRAHPENVEGPFYVEHGCCLACGVPVDAAPDIFDWAGDESSCIVKRQPISPAELDRTMVAICSAEVDCIRYRGTDPEIFLRLAQAGHAENCDLPSGDAHPLLRLRIRFASAVPDDTPQALAARLRAWLAGKERRFLRVKPASPSRPNSVVFSWDHGPLPWWRAHYNSVRFEAGPEGFRAFLQHGHRGSGVGLGLFIQQWLTESEQARDIKWYGASEDWDGAGLHMPV
jgi:hypothetical protein